MRSIFFYRVNNLFTPYLRYRYVRTGTYGYEYWELRADIIAQLSRPLVHARFGPHSDNNFSSAHIDHWVTNVPRTGLPCPRERQL